MNKLKRDKLKEIIAKGKWNFVAKYGLTYGVFMFFYFILWDKFIKLLRDNPKLRMKIGTEARKEVIDKFSLKAQATLYLKIFNKTLKNKK